MFETQNIFLKGVLWFALLGMASLGYGQGDFDFKHPIKVSGGATANTGLYTAFGAPSRRDPFSYQLNINLNFKLLGQIDMPFSAGFSQQESNFSQPFNQYGISPKYKWATVHIGYRNLTFSELTLAGHTFLGGGVELTPGKWKIGAMYGRLRRSIEEADALAEGAQPAFRRMGAGVMVGYENKGDAIEVSLFQASDVLSSIRPIVDENTTTTPESNLVMGIRGKKKLAKKLDLEAEYARSAVTRDTRSPQAEGNSSIAYFGPLFDQKTSSAVHPAMQGKLTYKGKAFNLNLKYRRIDTDYRTLGAYFFNNDLEDATVNLTTNLFQKKVSLAGSIGGQRNNLQADKATQNSRLIGSLNLGYAPNQDWNFSLTGSNFTSYLKVDRDILSDSLNFYQVTRNVGGNILHNFGSEDRPQNFGINIALQSAVGRQEYSIDADSKTDFLNIAVSHVVKFKPIGFDIQSMGSFTHTIMPEQTSTFFGPVVGFNKVLWGKKLKATYRASYQTVLVDGAVNSTVFTNRLNATVKLGEHHGLSGGVDFLRKQSQSATSTTFSEMRGLAGYSFNF